MQFAVVNKLQNLVRSSLITEKYENGEENFSLLVGALSPVNHCRREEKRKKERKKERRRERKKEWVS